MKVIGLILAICAIQVVYGHYQGPFLLWGVDNLNDMKIPTLQGRKITINIQILTYFFLIIFH